MHQVVCIGLVHIQVPEDMVIDMIMIVTMAATEAGMMILMGMEEIGSIITGMMIDMVEMGI